MNKFFIDLCYEILFCYVHFPEVADTLNNILRGKNIVCTYPITDVEFQKKRDEIISYILITRANNIIYIYLESKIVSISGGHRKTILDENQEELRRQLESEIQMLILCGIHKIIKRIYPTVDNSILIEELLQLNVGTLKKYGLYS